MLGGKPERADGKNEASGKSWKPVIKIVRAAIVFTMEMEHNLLNSDSSSVVWACAHPVYTFKVAEHTS
jgi:hypothetical protein